MEDYLSFGRWLKDCRKGLDLTQDELARRVGCALVTIKKMEADDRRPSRQIAQRLVDILEISPEEQPRFLRLARTPYQQEQAATLRPTPWLPDKSEPLADLQGQVLKGYQLRERIGVGGFGVVYRAIQPSVARDVAIKIVLPQFANHPAFVRRFEAEAQLVARIEHPHIVPLYDYWREVGGAYLVMRWMRGGSLHDALKHGPWSGERAVRLLDQITAALSVAHRQNVVHRDIKPANILLDQDGNAYLADFGIAKELTTASLAQHTQTAALLGTLKYLAPEQIKDEPITPQTDIYNLGVLLYEVLAGASPFGDTPPATLLYKHLYEPLPSLHVYRPELPAALDAVIRRATAKCATARYADVYSFSHDLRQALTPTALATAGVIDPPTVANPYKGLRSFTEADASDFFGRETFTEHVIARLGEECEYARFLAVVGPSGSGKSSLVRASVLPALRRGALPGSESWFFVELLPGLHPFAELEQGLRRVAVVPPANLAEQLVADDHGLVRAVQQLLPSDEETELVLIVDQFEEVWTLVEDEAARLRLLEGIWAAVTAPDSRIRVIVTLRADFYDRPLQYMHIGELLRCRSEFVLPMTPDELERAITGPADRAGLRLEQGLTGVIIRDVGEQPGSLPLLQYALTELFERREVATVTRAAYQNSGGVNGALARRADELFDRLDALGQATARQLFLRLITLGEGVEDTRRRVQRSELAAIAPAEDVMDRVINLYGQYRLLTFDRDPSTRNPTVEVAHEALIRSWGRLQAWLQASREELRTERRLLSAAEEWMSTGQEASFLATGARLAQFEALARSDINLSPEEQAYLHSSIMAHQAQIAQAEAARERELAHVQALAAAQQQRAEEQELARTRLHRRAIWLAGVTLLALAAAAFAGLQQRQAKFQAAAAQRQAGLALARQIVVQILNLSGEQDAEDLRLLLSVAATRIADTGEARGVLLDSLQRSSRLQAFLRGHRETIKRVAFSPDGSLLASAGVDKTVFVWDVAQRRPLGSSLVGHTASVTSVAFSPDGQLLATGSDDKTIIFWDVATRQPRGQRISGLSSPVNALAWSPDGKLLASASSDGSVQFWEVASRTLLGLPQRAHTVAANDLAWSPDGKLLASASSDQTIRLWDVANQSPLGSSLREHTGAVHSLAWSPDGKLLASASSDRTIQLWDIASRKPSGPPMEASSTTVWSIAFSPDGTTLASGDHDGIIHWWDLVSRRPLGSPLKNHTDRVSSIAFSPDGSVLASASADRRILLWDVARRPLPSGLSPTAADRDGLTRLLKGHTDSINSVAFSPGGALLASGSADRSVRLWSTATHEAAGLLATGGSVTGVAFSADGTMLATASSDKTIQLWSVNSRQPLGPPLQGHTSIVWNVTFSPDGKTLASGSQDGMIKLWDVVQRTELELLLPVTSYAVNSIAFSPDGKLLAAGREDGSVVVWDVARRRPLHEPLQGHTTAVCVVAFSPDGITLASASSEIIFWDVATGQPLGELLISSNHFVNGLAFSPDGKLFASAGDDTTVRLWDRVTRQAIGSPLALDGGPINSVAFSPDGNTLAVGTSFNDVFTWNVHLASWQARACWLANRSLTKAEWERFVGVDIPYQAPCDGTADDQDTLQQAQRNPSL